MFKQTLLLTFVLAAFTVPAAARDEAFFGWPSARAFHPYRPYHDGAILFPEPYGAVPVHVRVYSTPMQPPYYNVPPYIVLDP